MFAWRFCNSVLPSFYQKTLIMSAHATLSINTRESVCTLRCVFVRFRVLGCVFVCSCTLGFICMCTYVSLDDFLYL